MCTGLVCALFIHVKVGWLIEGPLPPPTSSKSPCWLVSAGWPLPGSCTLGPGSDSARGTGRRSGCDRSADFLRT